MDGDLGNHRGARLSIEEVADRVGAGLLLPAQGGRLAFVLSLGGCWWAV